MAKIHFHKILVLAALGLSLAQCGEQGALSKDVDVSYIPENPLVVHADLTFQDINGDDVEIKAPWFLMGFRVVNNSDKRLYLATFTLEGSTVGPNGMLNDFTVSVDPSEFCENRGYIAVIDGGVTFERPNVCDAFDPQSGPAAGSRYEQWYFNSLPASDNDIYTIEVNGEGWFVDADDVPIERLISNGFVVTQ